MTKDDTKLNMSMPNIKIVYEDPYLLVLDKPQGIVVNRSNTSPFNTVQDFIEGSFSFLKNVPEVPVEDMTEADIEEFISRSGVVHRLDKDTSGVLLVAKDVLTFRKIKELFKTRKIQKEYIALVLGEIKELKLEINAPIKRNPSNPLKLAVVHDGKPALTLIENIKVIERDATKFTLLKVFPKTGRTHQIRVHLSAVGHPIVCDPIYLTKANYELTSKYFSRLMLHARSVSFVHPNTDDLVTYSTDLPKEFNL